MRFFRRRTADKTPHLTADHAHALIAGSPLPMALIDDQSALAAANTAWRRLLGEGQLLDLLEPGDATLLLECLRAAPASSGEPAELTVRWLRPGGEIALCRTTATRLPGAHHTGAHVLLTLTDLTEQERFERWHAEHETALRLQSMAAQVLTHAGIAEDVWPALLQAVAEAGGWSAGILWQSPDGGETLYSAAHWHDGSAAAATFVNAVAARPLRRAEGFPGKLWGRRELGWLPDLTLADRSFHTAKADTAGLRSTVCIPLRAQQEMYGVMELLGTTCRELPDFIVDVLTGIAADVTRTVERLAAEAPLRASETRFRTIAEMAREGIITIDEESRILFVNQAAESIFGYREDELLGQSLTMLMPESLRHAHYGGVKRFIATGGRRVRWENLEFPGLRKDGTEIALEISLAEVSQGDERLFTGFVRDITQQKREESALVYQALHDALTDLPNRNLLQERLNRAILVSHRHSNQLALLFMDLDRFKDVNDTFGHHCGDQLLQQVAGRLVRTLRESDTVARLGGDEFAMLLPSTEERGAILTANRILGALKTSFEVDGHSFDIGASIGIAHYPQHGGDAATLMRRADVAMYAAKRASSGYAIYSADRDEINSLRLLLTKELRQAIESDQMRLFYQPKVNLGDDRTEHVEALIRWEHPDRGLTSPDAFIPLAEETGLVKPLTVWVLNEALRQHREWREMGIDLRVAVNFSARVLHDPDLLGIVTELLSTWKVEPQWLEVEITESAIMVDPDRARETLTALHSAGIWTSIDDFGTGHSSLAYLRRLPFDEIKIDKSFVLDMATNRDDASIVRSVVALGHNFELKVVAEGVDNQRTLDMLRKMDCDIAQGYFLSRPIAPKDLVRWLRERDRSLAQAS
jgi:diguanylate cyclase (GGDEF)-like protein/PAS domain S-box-containing protein